MLATTKERRGQRLARILGAKVLLEMRERFGLKGFFTGVWQGNAVSEAVYRKLGLKPDGTSVVPVVDLNAMPGGKRTR